MGFFFASWLWALPVQTTGSCPSAAAIERRLEPLLGGSGAAALTDVARLVRDPTGGLVLSLAEAGGRAIGERRFPRQSCDEEAETVAVTLAIWEAQLHPEITLRLDRLSAPPRPERVAAASELPPASTSASAPASTPASPPFALSLGAAGGVDRQGDHVAAAVRGELGLGPAGRRWHPRLAVLGTTTHAQDVPLSGEDPQAVGGKGQARWWRLALGAGAFYDLVDQRHVALQLGAMAVLGAVTVSGRGFDRNQTARSLDFGGEAWLRVVGKLGNRGKADSPGSLHLWLGAAVVGWARRQSLDVAGETTSSALPRLATTLVLGVDLVW